MAAPDAPRGEAIACIGVSVCYGSTVVVPELDVRVAFGSMVCIAGRSGSGKTSLLNIAAGLLRPSSGRVTWEGLDIGTMGGDLIARHRRGFMGLAFQSPSLLPSLTAAENVALAGLRGRTGSDGRQTAVDLLDTLGIGSLANRFPHQLSGGEQQRVGLARALFGAPRVALVDEPTANLDRTMATRVADLLLEHARAGHAVMVASHDERLISRADQAIALEG